MKDDYEYEKLINNEQSHRRISSFLSLKFFKALSFFGLFSIVGLLYLYVNCKDNYDIFVDGKLVNFTGVEDFIPPFINYWSNIFVDNDHKLISCGIPKSMSQLTINIMCLLYDKENFEANHHSLNDSLKAKRDCYTEEHFKTPSLETENSNDTVRFAFIRDPFQRFVSFYIDRCVHYKKCYGCGTDVRCVAQHLYQGLQKIKNHRNRNHPITHAELHGAPLTWMCDFEKGISKWHFLMMGADTAQRKSSALQLSNILKVQGIDSNIVERIEKGIMAGETAHGTHKSSLRIEVERQIREDLILRDLLHKIYFFDYLVFPFNRSPLDAKYQTNFWTLPKN